jgi:non-ribosomal peptide synthetase component E (peptide arylation enzyme)
MAAARRPTLAAVKSAAATLSRAPGAEAERVRQEQGHSGHSLAQELEREARRVANMPAVIEEMRRTRP